MPLGLPLRVKNNMVEVVGAALWAKRLFQSLATTPVLAMTALHESEDRATYVQAGMQGVIHKPLNAAQAMAVIADVLAAAPAKDHEATLGDATEFLTESVKSLWPRMAPDA